MKITRKNLLDIIKEELDSVVSEQGMIDGEPVTLGGQQVRREELIKTSFDKIDEAISSLNALAALKLELKQEFQEKVANSTAEIQEYLELQNIQDLINLIKSGLRSRVRRVEQSLAKAFN